MIKTISWLLLTIITTIFVAYLITKNIHAAFYIGGIELFVLFILYFVHEKIWYKLKYNNGKIKPAVIWFTGLSGSGKSTMAVQVYKRLKKRGLNVEHLDGDKVREIFPNTGFTKNDRNTHIKRVGYLAGKLEKNGIIVIASFISPYKESRDFVRNLCNNFVEIYVSTPLEECERRDTKGLYAKARNGEIKNFTGIDAVYEKPENSELTINSANLAVNKSVEQVMQYIDKELRV